jgi:hypothetical protein
MKMSEYEEKRAEGHLIGYVCFIVLKFVYFHPIDIHFSCVINRWFNYFFFEFFIWLDAATLNAKVHLTKEREREREWEEWREGKKIIQKI